MKHQHRKERNQIGHITHRKVSNYNRADAEIHI